MCAGFDAYLDKPIWEQVWVWWKAKEHYYKFVIPMSKEDCKGIYGN